MKIIIDTESCKKMGRDVDLVLYLVSFYTKTKITPATFEKARQQGLIRFNDRYSPSKLDPAAESNALTDR